MLIICSDPPRRFTILLVLHTRTLVGDEIRQGMLGGKVYINRAQGTHNDCNNYNGRLVYIASWGWAIPGPVDSCFVFKQRASWSIGESEDIPVTPTPPSLLFCDVSPFLLFFFSTIFHHFLSIFSFLVALLMVRLKDFVIEAKSRLLRISLL